MDMQVNYTAGGFVLIEEVINHRVWKTWLFSQDLPA